MNPIQFDRAFDAPAAKTAAKNLKSRLRDLGMEIQTTHAYEGVAAVLGCPSWNVLKAALAEKTAQNGKSPEMSEPSIMPDEASPLAVLYAAPALHRRVTDALRLSLPPSSTPLRRLLRTISLGTPPNFEERGSRDDQGRRTRVVFRAERPMPISVFDTPLGRRLPTPEHRARVALFLASVIRIVHDLEATPSVLSHLEELVDALYLHHSEWSPKGEPFRRTASSTTSEELERAGIRMLENETWWSAADRAQTTGNFALARAAQSNAVPRLSYIIPFVRGYASPLTDSGETLTNLLARAVSFAYRTHPCFSFEESRFGEEERIAYDRIDFDIDARSPKVAAALYVAAFNAAAIEADDYSASSIPVPPRQARTPVHVTMALERTETALAAFGTTVGVRRLLEHASVDGRACLAMTESVEVASVARSMSAMFAVTACSSTRNLDAICDLLALEAEEGDVVEEAMTRESLTGSLPAVFSVRRNRRTSRRIGEIDIR